MTLCSLISQSNSWDQDVLEMVDRQGWKGCLPCGADRLWKNWSFNILSPWRLKYTQEESGENSSRKGSCKWPLMKEGKWSQRWETTKAGSWEQEILLSVWETQKQKVLGLLDHFKETIPNTMVKTGCKEESDWSDKGWAISPKSPSHCSWHWDCHRKAPNLISTTKYLPTPLGIVLKHCQTQHQTGSIILRTPPHNQHHQTWPYKINTNK